MGTDMCTIHKNSANFASTAGSLSGVMNFFCENHDFSNLWALSRFCQFPGMFRLE